MDFASEGIEEIAWLDFPDYSNVGDSAIWLGQLTWARSRGKRTKFIVPERAITSKLLRRIAKRDVVPIITGGGNLGGLYPTHDASRSRVFEAFTGRSIIQAPQSVHFTSRVIEDQILEKFSAQPALTVLVRDESSYDKLSGLGKVQLVPDSAHMLGVLNVPAAIRPYSLLVRTDQESSAGIVPGGDQNDWLTEPNFGRRIRQVIAASAGVSGLTWPIRGLNYSRHASRRLERGLVQIAMGETVVTDRLHAMILGLQCGRRVVAVDNAVKKLSRYASLWYSDLDGGTLQFAPDVATAIDLASA
ncbi:polysaccharide pyruvyl transferase family protein [Rhodococcus sp. BP-252]|nr:MULTISPECIES: polysaccharide pyruvyl transferase family protein [unclassified Rhodococcus (in: high G+C Gram-positive bacteria)]MBY6448328.1 polysaccharide pyruvyl transferase family protein [Rhodococcus sp. BP-318]MBY6463001.1 polysaccharide pyruvyl transferase family protein [Rhodococcus sp. BP-260]MBY6472728.1 polysaccharide pyruvyl transferase family protein [Rhodococcus sp. BP-313]MBY6414873.1 polysaccharide pyruvyl transferase family protein [Rhodococcus sp. BP-320]MBY6419837.1 polysa